MMPPPGGIPKRSGGGPPGPDRLFERTILAAKRIR